MGSDPQVKAGNGNPFTALNVCVNQRQKQSTGEWVDTPVWFKVLVFGKHGETVAQHAKKGQKVYIMGKLEVQTWKDKETSNERMALSIMAAHDGVQILEKKQKQPEKKAEEGPPLTDDDIPF